MSGARGGGGGDGSCCHWDCKAVFPSLNPTNVPYNQYDIPLKTKCRIHSCIVNAIRFFLRPRNFTRTEILTYLNHPDCKYSDSSTIVRYFDRCISSTSGFIIIIPKKPKMYMYLRLSTLVCRVLYVDPPVLSPIEPFILLSYHAISLSVKIMFLYLMAYHHHHHHLQQSSYKELSSLAVYHLWR